MFNKGLYRQVVPFTNDILNFTNRLTPNVKHISINFSTYMLAFKNVLKLEPLFSFYIYKVDKKIFKNTRGKSGKYTFL